MTKEELKQEAEAFVSEKADKGNFDLEQFGKAYFSDSSMKQALVKFAEPREKRIAELEAQIEKMKCWCNCKNYISCLEDCCRKNISFSKGICYNCKKWEIKEK